MVAEAVTVEPVSALNFPANREKNRDLSDSWLLSCQRDSKNLRKCRTIEEVPYSTEQGTILAQQRLLTQEQRKRSDSGKRRFFAHLS